MEGRNLLFGVVAFLALVALVVVVYFATGRAATAYNPSAGTGQHYAQVPVELTDPGFLPRGTSSLLITFSNVSASINNSVWIDGGGFGPVNLMALSNVTRTISVLDIPANESVALIRMGVSSIRIDINGTVYNATVPGNAIVSALANGNAVGRGRSILISVSPSAFASVTRIRPGIEMAYGAVGTVVNGSGSYVGQQEGLETSERAALDASAGSLSIDSANLSANGSGTAISVSVSAASEPTQIRSVVIIGPENVSYNQSGISEVASSYADSVYAQAQAELGSRNSNTMASGLISSIFGNQNVADLRSAAGVSDNRFFNESLVNLGAIGDVLASNISTLFGTGITGSLTGGGVNETAKLDTLRKETYASVEAQLYNSTGAAARFQERIGATAFSVGQDGMLSTAHSRGTGMYLAAGQSARLSFTGTIPVGQLAYASLVRGANYTIVVVGSGGAASYSVTAG